MVGTDKTVQAAIQKNGLEKLKRIVKSLTSCSHIHTLLFHWFGNYTLQDLVAASSKLRTAAVAALQKAQVFEHLSTHQVVQVYVGRAAEIMHKVQAASGCCLFTPGQTCSKVPVQQAQEVTESSVSPDTGDWTRPCADGCAT